MRFTMKPGSRGLCYSCEEAQVMTDPQGREVILCHVGMRSVRLPAPMKECSRYDPTGVLKQYEAEKIGWVLEMRKGQVIGFRPPKGPVEE
jgi:hypothetical protein